MRRIVLFVAALALSAGTANATLISADLYASGDGLLTRDTSTALEWLDLTATVGQSRSAVLGGSFVGQGFRYATQADVLQLWIDAGASGPFNNQFGSNYQVGNFVAANLLINLMGCTSQLVGDPCDGANQNFQIAFFGSGAADAALVDYFGPPDQLRAGLAAMWIDFGPTVDILHRPDVGSYLVRAVAVPEPGSMFMLGAGLIAAIAVRSKRRKKAQ